MKRISLIVVLLSVFGTGSVWAAEGSVANGSLQTALEFNRTNQVSTWVNPDTGQSGSTVPTGTFQNAVGQPCREFTQTITVAGEKQQGYGTACRQPDGSWQVVNDQPRAATQVGGAQQPQVVDVREEPMGHVFYDPYPYAYRPYYPYGYDPFYFPVSLAFSFGYFHSSGHGGGHYRGHGWGGGRGHHR